MNIQEINNEIVEAGRKSVDDYLRRFITLEKDIVDNVNSLEGLQTEVYMHHEPRELEQIQYASIFSDFVSLYMGQSSVRESHITYFDAQSEYYREIQLTIPGSLTGKIRPNVQQIIPGYGYHKQDDLQGELNAFKPLFDISKSMLRPVRTVWVDQQPITHRREGVIYYAQGNTDPDKWTVRDDFPRHCLPIADFLNNTNSKVLFDLTLPYFRGIELSTLAKILNEEKDLLSPLRRELKKIVIEYDGTSSLEEIRQDLLRPETDTINRKFNQYKRAHKSKVIGGVGLFAAALMQVYVAPEKMSEFIAAVVGSGGLSGIFLSEREFQKDINELRDNPYFLLWRLKRRPRL